MLQAEGQEHRLCERSGMSPELGPACYAMGRASQWEAPPAVLRWSLRNGFVNGELFDVRRPRHLHPRGGDPRLDLALKKSIEVSSRLPEIDDTPAVIDRAGRVVQHPLRDRSIRIDVVLRCIELFLGDPGQLHADA